MGDSRARDGHAKRGVLRDVEGARNSRVVARNFRMAASFGSPEILITRGGRSGEA